MTDPVLALSNLARSFEHGDEIITPLRDISFDIAPGQMVALTSPSGAGKSTLLHIAGLLDRPDSGGLWICGEDLSKAGDRKRTDFRKARLGFIYQAHHLLPEFTAIENVMLPQLCAGVRKRAARDRSAELLTELGLSDRMDHRPARLSGGQSQRVAIARALANHPDLILADEPTGSLDPETSRRVFDMLLETCRRAGASALIATHDRSLAGQMDRCLKLADGKVAEVP